MKKNKIEKNAMKMRKLELVVEAVGIIISGMLLVQGFINQGYINIKGIVDPVEEMIILGDIIVVNINVEAYEVEGA